ncbi:MAG TPA: HlyD family efflux transporter periplasmic adaptor subunit [Burkholderiales bacterium]|nr:HlyD family efflux transporter periplasmic adaptor subunit [Burkholderiales bacterium]
MRMPRLMLTLGLASCLGGCGPTPDAPYQGYAEGEYVLVASPYAGALQQLAVTRGQQITSGADLFVLEQGNEIAARREAEERLRSAQARLDNLRAAQRPAQLDALQAQLRDAEEARALSASQLKRNRTLFEQEFISQAVLDEGITRLRRDEAHLAQVNAQIRLAQASVGRSGEVAAAKAEVEAARAVLEQADWRLGQKSVPAPVAGLVQNTFYVPGEWVPAGKPVVSILPPANIKLRFYVPETAVGALRIGQSLSVSCDGCASPVAATLRYISTEPEYTPPVIYSRESRAKLVFLVEARPSIEDAIRLKPGQPVDVMLSQR